MWSRQGLPWVARDFDPWREEAGDERSTRWISIHCLRRRENSEGAYRGLDLQTTACLDPRRPYPAAGTTLALRPWFLHWGTNETERRRQWSGDELTPAPLSVATRGITIHAPASRSPGAQDDAGDQSAGGGEGAEIKFSEGVGERT